MNVLLVAPWDQKFGGVASVVGNLGRYLEGRGHRVLFFHPGEPNAPRQRTTTWGFVGYEQNLREPWIAGRRLRSSAGFLVYLVPTLIRLARLLRSQRIDVVNVHYPESGFVYFGILRLLLPFRLVVSIHGADFFPGGNPLRSYPLALKLLLRLADAVVAPSQSLLSDYVAVFPANSPRCIAIHNGIDLEELQRPSGAPAAANEPPYLLCVAAHNSKKGLDVLLNAFTTVRQDHRGLRLLLVGDGPLRGEHEGLARTLMLNGEVEFLGWRGREDVVRLLHGCRVFVLPSRSEPFGIVVVEALACRKPVVASAVGGIPEIIQHERSGILVEPDNPAALARGILSLLNDASLSASVSEEGQARAVEHFSFVANGRRYEQLYLDVTRRTPGSDQETALN